MKTPSQRLAALGITLPTPPAAAGLFVPFVRTGSLVYLSGQVSLGPDGGVFGHLGDTVDVPAGREAARLAALNLLARLAEACGGSLDAVTRVVRLGGFVACVPSFTQAPAVVDGASELLLSVFGDAGRHVRTAVGVAALPRGVAVELDGVFEVADAR